MEAGRRQEELLTGKPRASLNPPIKAFTEGAAVAPILLIVLLSVKLPLAWAQSRSQAASPEIWCLGPSASPFQCLLFRQMIGSVAGIQGGRAGVGSLLNPFGHRASALPRPCYFPPPCSRSLLFLAADLETELASFRQDTVSSGHAASGEGKTRGPNRFFQVPLGRPGVISGGSVLSWPRDLGLGQS